jgi:hypothetical protein
MKETSPEYKRPKYASWRRNYGHVAGFCSDYGGFFDRRDPAVVLHEIIMESDPNMEGGFTHEVAKKWLDERAKRRAESGTE